MEVLQPGKHHAEVVAFQSLRNSSSNVRRFMNSSACSSRTALKRIVALSTIFGNGIFLDVYTTSIDSGFQNEWAAMPQ
ncbi:hypothetical protein TNCV_47331 [Trichonephila clavipes]|nr:hypothetical protein TNCV_47331 [Trichonephila clavipes]